MKKKIIGIIAAVIIIIVILFLLISTNNPQDNNSIPAQENDTAPELKTNCNSNQECISNNLINCKAAEYKTDFGTDWYVIEVIGIENNKCHFLTSILSKTDNSIITQKNCNYPIAQMTQAVFLHLFGADKTPDLQTTFNEQEALANENCN